MGNFFKWSFYNAAICCKQYISIRGHNKQPRKWPRSSKRRGNLELFITVQRGISVHTFLIERQTIRAIVSLNCYPHCELQNDDTVSVVHGSGMMDHLSSRLILCIHYTAHVKVFFNYGTWIVFNYIASKEIYVAPLILCDLTTCSHEMRFWAFTFPISLLVLVFFTWNT